MNPHRKPSMQRANRAADTTALKTEIARLQRIIEAQNNRLHELTTQACHDSLTGLSNRRGFENAIGNAISNHHRYNHGGAILMIDLNKFKPINDTYGHAAGDAILMHVANILKANVRETDLVARLGGDEFVIILQEATHREALQKAAHIAMSIRTTPCLFNGVALQVSASVGTVTFKEGPDASALLKLADKRMYQAKHGPALALANA